MVIVTGIVIVGVIADARSWRRYGRGILYVDHRVRRRWRLRGGEGHDGGTYGDAEGKDRRDGRGDERRPHSLRVGRPGELSPLTGSSPGKGWRRERMDRPTPATMGSLPGRTAG